MRGTLSKIRTFLFFLYPHWIITLWASEPWVWLKKKAARKKKCRSCLEKVYVRINCRRLKMLCFFLCRGIQWTHANVERHHCTNWCFNKVTSLLMMHRLLWHSIVTYLKWCLYHWLITSTSLYRWKCTGPWCVFRQVIKHATFIVTVCDQYTNSLLRGRF